MTICSGNHLNYQSCFLVRVSEGEIGSLKLATQHMGCNYTKVESANSNGH